MFRRMSAPARRRSRCRFRRRSALRVARRTQSPRQCRCSVFAARTRRARPDSKMEERKNELGNATTRSREIGKQKKRKEHNEERGVKEELTKGGYVCQCSSISVSSFFSSGSFRIRILLRSFTYGEGAACACERRARASAAVPTARRLAAADATVACVRRGGARGRGARGTLAAPRLPRTPPVATAPGTRSVALRSVRWVLFFVDRLVGWFLINSFLLVHSRTIFTSST